MLALWGLLKACWERAEILSVRKTQQLGEERIHNKSKVQHHKMTPYNAFQVYDETLQWKSADGGVSLRVELFANLFKKKKQKVCNQTYEWSKQ